MGRALAAVVRCHLLVVVHYRHGLFGYHSEGENGFLDNIAERGMLAAWLRAAW